MKELSGQGMGRDAFESHSVQSEPKVCLGTAR